MPSAMYIEFSRATPSLHVFPAWVKNVYNLWVHGVVNGANLSPTTHTSRKQATQVVVKVPLFTQVINTFPPRLSTRKITLLPLVNRHLSPLSTAPTINKMNKK